jgi:hypothetical protein
MVATAAPQTGNPGESLASQWVVLALALVVLSLRFIVKIKRGVKLIFWVDDGFLVAAFVRSPTFFWIFLCLLI